MVDSFKSEELIPLHGGYRHLKTFQIAQLVYDVTARFCDQYIDRRSRTHDQMVQAAAFEKEGGFTERLYRVRQQNRANQKTENRNLPNLPPRNEH